jgi:hypothetical protein
VARLANSLPSLGCSGTDDLFLQLYSSGLACFCAGSMPPGCVAAWLRGLEQLAPRGNLDWGQAKQLLAALVDSFLRDSRSRRGAWQVRRYSPAAGREAAPARDAEDAAHNPAISGLVSSHGDTSGAPGTSAHVDDSDQHQGQWSATSLVDVLDALSALVPSTAGMF